MDDHLFQCKLSKQIDSEFYKVSKWLAGLEKGSWKYFNSNPPETYTITFKYEKDAILFKLKFL